MKPRRAHSFARAAFHSTLGFLSMWCLPRHPIRAQTAAPLPHIDHRFTNTDAQSLIGLPMGSHKTVVQRTGSLEWSQWSLKRKPLDTPIGFSDQMDGALAIEPASVDNGKITPATMVRQSLYRGRYPFIETELVSGALRIKELAFAADPEQNPATLPGAHAGAHAVDVIRITLEDAASTPLHAVIHLSGRARNLPGHVHLENGRPALISETGEDVAFVDPGSGLQASSASNGLSLALDATLQPGQSKTVWLRLPYEWPAVRNREVTHLSGEALLAKATAQWDAIWSRSTRIHYPQPQLNDFFDSSLAYVLILTEYDARGDLWALDGPAVYRQYWGRGEYFQARALEVGGLLEPARQTVEHAFHIQNDDGEWDGPPTSGWPAWDNIGGNAGAVWEYYQFTRDRDWLARAYPHLLQASEWVRAHREETTLEDVPDVPAGARPIHRNIPAKCRVEPQPPLKPGEKTYWYGLLPWSYGDSGLPEGHSYSHNFLADFGVRVTAQAADVLGHTKDAAWLSKEYTDYTDAIRDSINRSVMLEHTASPYLPAMPTRPDAAYSQTFLAISPTGIYAPDDPLVTGLLTRMEHEEVQGLATNVAWAGPAGVWAGEAMNMSEAYLLRGEVTKNAEMLVAALNHSYTTNVWKEEILTDVTKERACDTPHSKRQNMQGTGDQPEAWANANLVDLLRDMLVQERENATPGNTVRSPVDMTLHLLAGLPADWLPAGQEARLTNAPTTTGDRISLQIRRTSPTHLLLTFNISGPPVDIDVHVPLAPDQHVRAVSLASAPSEKIKAQRGSFVLPKRSGRTSLSIDVSDGAAQ